MSVYHAVVFLHLLTAIVWMGGMVFVYAIVMPFLRNPQHGPVIGPLSHWVSRRFRRLAQVSLVVLVVTGTWAAAFRGATWKGVFSGSLWAQDFGKALLWKVGAVVLLTALSLTADFLIVPWLQKASRVPEKRAGVAFWHRYLELMGHFNVFISVVIVALAVILVRGWPF